MVKAHVIPEAFFRDINYGDASARLLTNTDGIHPKRAPIGIYDRTILCSDCELTFQRWDDYAIRYLRLAVDNLRPIAVNGETLGWHLPACEHESLKLFFISVIWRATVSTHTFYSRIDIGELEDTAKSFIEKSSPGTTEDFAVFLATFDHSLGNIMQDPFLEKYQGVKFARFYLGRFIAYIKIDSRPVPTLFQDYILKSGQPPFALLRAFKTSGEYSVALDVIRKNKSP